MAKLPQGGIAKYSTGSIKDADWARGNIATMRAQRYQHPRGSFKKGGKVKATGVYRLHKGEQVLTSMRSLKNPRACSGSIKLHVVNHGSYSHRNYAVQPHLLILSEGGV